MRKTLTCLAFVAATCAVATAQVVNVEPHDNATDIWGPYFNTRKTTTFTGYIKGVVKGKPAGAEVQDALIVKNASSGQVVEVEVGPDWFVNDQHAKLHMGDKVRVTGTKLKIGHSDVFVASQVLLRGQGGPVLALRRPSGRAYWMPAAIAAKPDIVAAKTEPPADETQTETIPPYYPPTMLDLNNGQLLVSTGVSYGYANNMMKVNPFTTVVNGAYPFIIRPW